jgi:glycosyltransferase involved in cell wall biosynthesis
MKNKLVSIITPCYNGEKYIHRFLDSVLSQTYDNIELLIVNDGSTDNTEKIIKSYQDAFDAKGYKLIYMYQENAGQSVAINKALLKFSGDYLTWPDSDDFLAPSAIEKKVQFLEQNTMCGMVICKTEVLEDTSLAHKGYQQRVKPQGKDNLFEDLIMGNNVYYSPGGYMLRTSMFRDVMPKPLQIQAPREIGQNYQLLLPMAYKYPAGYLEDVLYYYLVRIDSHSREKHSYEYDINRSSVAVNVLTNIVNSLEMSKSDYAHYMDVLKQYRLNGICKIMLTHHRSDNSNEAIAIAKLLNIYNGSLKRKIYYIKYPVYRLAQRIYSKLRTIIFSANK